MTQVQNPSWARRLTGGPLVALLILVILNPAVVYWTDQRLEMHALWQTNLHLAQTFYFYGMEQAGVVLTRPNYTSDVAVREWAFTALQTADNVLNQISKTDLGHTSQLSRIDLRLVTLISDWTEYTTSLTSSERTILSNIFYSVGRDVLYGYANYMNYTSTNDVSGPPFWYFGPSPPDENLLQQAADLLVNLSSLPPLPT